MSSSTSKRSAKETGFLKTFPSDIDDASVLKLLMEIRTSDALYRDFTTRDMKLLSQLISALQFQPGDKIIQKNEEASFLGIVLKGTFASVIDDKLNVALRRGEMFGELEFMEGGLRKADMVAATQGVLGILTYEDVKLIGLTSVDLHMRLLQAISVSSIKKLRQGGVSLLGSATPKVRSRRASFSIKDSPTISTANLNQRSSDVGASPSASPSMSPSYRIVKSNDDLPMLDSASVVRTESSSSAPDESLSSPSPSPMSPDPTAGTAIVIHNAATVSTPLAGPQPDPPQLVGDEEALAAAVAAATTDEATPSAKHVAKKHSEDGLELLFRYRTKKNPGIKPRRIEADVMNLIDSTIPTAKDSKDGVTLPPLASGSSSDKQPGSARGSMTGGGMQNLPINSQASPASSPAVSSSSSGDKNYNYVLYTLRNKVARQEDMLDEKDRQLLSLQTELKAALEEKERETNLRFEMEMKCEGLSNGIRSAEERAQKAESDVHSLREQLVKKSQQMEQMEAERKMMLEATGLTMANMHAKLIEHGEMLEVEGMSGAASSGSGGNGERNATSSSTNTASSSINAKDSKGSKFLASTSSLPASMQSSSLSRNSSSGALSNSPSVKPAKPSQLFPPSAQHSHSNSSSSVLLLSDQMTDYASQYEHMMSKLKDRLADQERQLIAMTKWKTRAQEFANTWDQERTRLKDRIKHGLIEIENLKTQKDSYKILLKILTVKLFMQHSQIRKTMKGFYRKMVELTTDILMEQKFSAGANGNKGNVNRGQSVQLENAEELLVRIQQKLSSKPWNTFALGSGGASSSSSQGIMGGLMGVGRSNKPNQRPPTLKILLDSMDDELGTLITANHEVLKSKRQWEETAQSFFLRNIELTQTISEHDTQLQQTKANLKTMERSLDEKDENLSSVRTSLASLEQNHKSALQAIHSNDARNKGDIRAKKAEVEGLFEKNVALRRKIREGELTITELEKKELRLHEKNEALLQEQKALIQAISNAKEVESQLLKGNHSQLNLLLQSQSSPHINASHLIASSPTSSKSLAPLIHSPSSRPNAPYSNNYMQNGPNPIYPRAASIPALFQQTMPVNGHTMQSQSSFGHLSQSSFITAPYATQSLQSTNSDGSYSHSQPSNPTQSLPVLATIRARPQAPQNAPLLTPQQWASFATLPPNLQPLSARPPPSLQPQSRKQRGGASTARVDKEKYAAVEKQQAHATKVALASALQRDSLDRALFRAAKAGLGRGFGTGAAKKIRKGPSHSGSMAHLQPPPPHESKEENTMMPQPPSTVSLKHMMENQSPD